MFFISTKINVLSDLVYRIFICLVNLINRLKFWINCNGLALKKTKIFSRDISLPSPVIISNEVRFLES